MRRQKGRPVGFDADLTQNPPAPSRSCIQSAGLCPPPVGEPMQSQMVSTEQRQISKAFHPKIANYCTDSLAAAKTFRSATVVACGTGATELFAWFAVRLIRPAASRTSARHFSPSDAEKELFCGTISRRRCWGTNTALISVAPSAHWNSCNSCQKFCAFAPLR